MDSYVQTGIKYFESNNYIILTFFFALFCQKNYNNISKFTLNMNILKL